MYLKDVLVESNGPLERVAFSLEFSAEGNPKPLILVGNNGSGKTNLLSIIADALFEAASAHFKDVLPQDASGMRLWFRLLGQHTIRIGAKASLAVLRFKTEDREFSHIEKLGSLERSSIDKIPVQMRAEHKWSEPGGYKKFQIDGPAAKEIFNKGSYCYFPASRSERPFWLNIDERPMDDFSLHKKFEGKIDKPIFVERALSNLKQWIMTTMLECRVEVELDGKNSQLKISDEIALQFALNRRKLLDAISRISQIVLDDKGAKLSWRNRHSGLGVILSGGKEVSLDAFSAGQATLFTIFGTILRYGADNSVEPKEFAGICVIDEVDAHVHIDLQYRALPCLMALFPKIQFIMSSHSPLFVFGMEKNFGADGITVLDLPSGMKIQAEAYSEFGRALDVLKDTQSFSDAVARSLSIEDGKLLIFVEGETDPSYFNAALDALPNFSLKDDVEFVWIGAKGVGGQGYNTGHNALSSAASMLKAQPHLVRRPTLLLFDNDTNRKEEDLGLLHIRCVPTTSGNGRIKKGTEHMLPDGVFTPDVIDVRETRKDTGDIVVCKSINKMKLCQKICVSKPSRDNFVNFEPALEIIRSVLELHR